MNTYRWEKLFQIVDQIGSVLKWTISPFFRTNNSVESLYQALQLGFQHRNHYSTVELGYISVVVFLRCIVAYYELLRSCCSSTFGIYLHIHTMSYNMYYKIHEFVSKF